MLSEISLFQANLEILAAAALALAIMWRLLRKQTPSAKLAALDPIMAPYRQGDYKAALAGAESLREKDPRQFHFFKGALLWQLGKLDEAATELKESLTLCQQAREAIKLGAARGGITASANLAKYGALTNVALGCVRMDQGRYDEAEKCFQTSLFDWPGHGGSHQALAANALRRGGHEQEALEYARLAVGEERAVVNQTRVRAGGSKIRAQVQNMRDVNLGETLATLAWAIAATSRDRSEADAAIAEAVELTEGRNVTSAAQVNLEAGLACAALNDLARAAEYWREAARIDPQGRSGRAARERLATCAEPITASK